MAYVTEADLVLRYGQDELVQLTNRAGGSTIDSAVLAAAIADAEAEVDGYLASRYAVPVTVQAALLRSIAATVVRYRLHGKSAGETVRRDYEDALRWLRDVSTGKVVLVGAASPSASEGTNGRVLNGTKAPAVFGPGGIDDWRLP
jgi:phage gp36-like protein